MNKILAHGPCVSLAVDGNEPFSKRSELMPVGGALHAGVEVGLISIFVLLCPCFVPSIVPMYSCFFFFLISFG